MICLLIQLVECGFSLLHPLGIIWFACAHCAMSVFLPFFIIHFIVAVSSSWATNYCLCVCVMNSLPPKYMHNANDYLGN